MMMIYFPFNIIQFNQFWLELKLSSIGLSFWLQLIFFNNYKIKDILKCTLVKRLW